MTGSPSPLPETCGVAFKEWAGVCEALTTGRQCLILRKGGIAEGPGGFAPEHPVFWLYPTQLHEAQQGLREEVARSAPEPPPPGLVDLPALAEVTEVGYLDRPEALTELADLHVWSEETIRQRFHYRRPGLWVLGVRVHRRPVPWRIAITPDHAGCKSWVSLEEPLSTTGLTPALEEPELLQRLSRLRSILTPAP